MAEKLNRSFFTSPYWPACLSGLVAPGLGQLFNRDYAKGLLLLSVSFVAFFWFSQVMTDQLSLILPGNPEQWQQNQEVFREAVMALVNKNPSMFITFHLLMITVWIFGIVDAFLTARQTQKPDKNANSHS